MCASQNPPRIPCTFHGYNYERDFLWEAKSRSEHLTMQIGASAFAVGEPVSPYFAIANPKHHSIAATILVGEINHRSLIIARHDPIGPVVVFFFMNHRMVILLNKDAFSRSLVSVAVTSPPTFFLGKGRQRRHC